jgi:hypothetical protein
MVLLLLFRIGVSPHMLFCGLFIATNKKKIILKTLTDIENGWVLFGILIPLIRIQV